MCDQPHSRLSVRYGCRVIGSHTHDSVCYGCRVISGHTHDSVRYSCCVRDFLGMSDTVDEQYTATESPSTLQWFRHMDGYTRIINLVFKYRKTFWDLLTTKVDQHTITTQDVGSGVFFNSHISITLAAKVTDLLKH